MLGFAPTYSMYGLLAAGTGTEWITADRDDDFELTPETAVAAVREHDPDIVLLCAPNNPTGTPLSLETITAVADAARGIVVVDEAYVEFADPGTPSALTLLEGRPRLLVSPHHEQGVRVRRRPRRLPRRRSRGRSTRSASCACRTTCPR